MRSWSWLAVAACATSVTAWAGQAQALVAPTTAASAAPVSSMQVQQRLLDDRVEIARLQHAVKQQESHSKQANERLRQQDAQIRKLQKQLQTLPKTVPPTGR